MGVEVIGTHGELFLTLESTAKKAVVRQMVDAGAKIQDLAVKMAPRDHGLLEEAIKMVPDRDIQQPRSATGQFGSYGKVEVAVYVDTDMPVPDRPGKTVGDYAYEVNEHMYPVGFMMPGPESQAKQSGQPELVGGAFLERAAEQVMEKEMDEMLMVALGEIMQSLS